LARGHGEAVTLEAHLRLHFDLGELPGGDRRLHEADGKFADLERPSRCSVPRTTLAAVVRFVVVLPMLASIGSVAALALVVICVPTLVVRGEGSRRRGVMHRRPLLMLTNLRELAAKAVE